MPTMREAGITESGNWIRADDLETSGSVFQIVGATFRPKRDIFPDQIIYHIQMLGDPDGAIYGDEVFTFSLALNDVRQKILDWFDNGGGALNGLDVEYSGIVLYKGQGGKGGNRPFLMRDATDGERSAFILSQEDAPDNDQTKTGNKNIPF